MPEFTVSSKRPVVVMDVEKYQDLIDRLERLEFSGDESAQRDLEQALKDYREGRTISLEEYDRKRLARRTVKKSTKTA